MILRACVICGRLSERYRCPTHRRDPRPSAAARGYDAVWHAIRDRYLVGHPMCEREGCVRASVDVDHVDGSGPRGDNSDENLMALCKPHHSEKTVLSDGGFGRPRARRDAA